jgi:hypothetical protein
MAGIYCLRTGLIQPNISELNKYFKINEVDKLIILKRAGKEEEPLRDLEERKLDLLIKDLFDKFDEAYLKSKIPEEPNQEDTKKLDNYLINIRLNH